MLPVQAQGLQLTHGLLCLGPDLCHTQHSVPGLGQTCLTLHRSSCPKLFPPHFIAFSHCTLPLMSQYEGLFLPLSKYGHLGSLPLKPFFQRSVR